MDTPLITVDILQVDHVFCHGYYRPTTPKLDTFAKQNTKAGFACQSCGYEMNVDYNRAKNIANGTAGISVASRSLAMDGLALKSGALNVKGDYTPAELLG